MSRAATISNLNSGDPNYQAGTLLPAEWNDPARLHLLSLALLGLEQGISVETPGHPVSQEAVESEVRNLVAADPQETADLLDKVIAPEALDDLTQRQGSVLVLEAIRDLLAAA